MHEKERRWEIFFFLMAWTMGKTEWDSIWYTLPESLDEKMDSVKR